MIAPNTSSQIIANALVTSSLIALVGIGFTLVYFVGKYINFAYGAFITCAAYFALLFSFHAGLSLVLSICLALLCTTIVGCLHEVFVFRPLQRREASPPAMLLASLGVYVVIQNALSMGFGDDMKLLPVGGPVEGFMILGAHVTGIQILTVCVSVCFVTALAAAAKWTKFGKAMRAIASDPELAGACGISKSMVVFWCTATSSLFAGTAGILMALDVGMVPTMGLEPLMMAVVAVIVAGVGSIPGVVLAALLVGFARHVGAWSIGSEWQDAIVFLVLLVFLVFRPEGFMGKKVKSTTV